MGKKANGGKKERGEKMKVTERVISKESGERYENLCQMNERVYKNTRESVPT